LPQPESAFNQTPRGIGELLVHTRLNMDCSVSNKAVEAFEVRCVGNSPPNSS
jgi:hypothetical protein